MGLISYLALCEALLRSTPYASDKHWMATENKSTETAMSYAHLGSYAHEYQLTHNDILGPDNSLSLETIAVAIQKLEIYQQGV